MPTTPAAHFGAAPSVDEEFLELVYADEQLLRAEFDAIVAREPAMRTVHRVVVLAPDGTWGRAVCERRVVNPGIPVPHGRAGNARLRGSPRRGPTRRPKRKK